MSRSLWLTAVLAISVALLPGMGLAEEQSGASSSSETTTTASAVTAAVTDAASVAAAPEAAPEVAPIVPPALKPITITFSGEVTSVNAGGSPASVTVQDRYGVKKEIAVPAEAKVSQGSTPADLAGLKAGDKVTVEYTYDVATGKRTAQSISVGEAAPAAQ